VSDQGTQASPPNRQDLRRLTQTPEMQLPYDEEPISPRRDVEVSTPIVPCSEYLAGFQLVTDTEDDEEKRPLFRRSFVAWSSRTRRPRPYPPEPTSNILARRAGGTFGPRHERMGTPNEPPVAPTLANHLLNGRIRCSSKSSRICRELGSPSLPLTRFSDARNRRAPLHCAAGRKGGCDEPA